MSRFSFISFFSLSFSDQKNLKTLEKKKTTPKRETGLRFCFTACLLEQHGIISTFFVFTAKRLYLKDGVTFGAITRPDIWFFGQKSPRSQIVPVDSGFRYGRIEISLIRYSTTQKTKRSKIAFDSIVLI